MLIVEPTGGLANRLRALDSAIAFKCGNNVNLSVLWIQNSDCNCKFSDLFIVPDEIKWLVELKSGVITRILRKIFRVYFSHSPNLFLDNKNIRVLKVQTGSAFQSISTLLNKLQKHGNAFIQTYNRFYYSSSYIQYSKLIPKESIQKIIDLHDNSQKIGIHLRRTDNEKSIIHSPLEKFIEAMTAEIVADKDVKFFLASDNIAV